MLGHGLAVDAVRAVAGQARIGPTVNLYPVHPKPGHPGAVDSARRIDGLQNRWFLDPLLRGGYPDDVRADLAPVTDFAFEQAGDAAVLNRPVDFLGVNYYSSYVVKPGSFPGSNTVDFVGAGRPRTAMGWEVDKDGLTETLRRVHDDYGPLPLFVTENGSAFDDVVTEDGRILDVERRDYLAAHLHACQQAIRAGVPLAGYFVWSLLDNFEWAEGYRRRFGIVHVDYATQQRRVKDSGAWYSAFISQHRVDRHRGGAGR
jgi:beta-glucosidase